MIKPWNINKPESADDKAFEIILSKILNHEIRPGDVIYEPELAESMNLSRTPVRNALKRFVEKGLLERRKRRKGYFVPALSPQDMEEVFQAREAIEGQIAFNAAQNASPEDIRFLRFLNIDEEKKFIAGERVTYADFNERFHFKIAEMGKNKYLERAFRPIYWRTQLYTFFLAGFYRSTEVPVTKTMNQMSYVEHSKIINAIEGGDPEAAKEAMTYHIHSTYTKRFISTKGDG